MEDRRCGSQLFRLAYRMDEVGQPGAGVRPEEAPGGALARRVDGAHRSATSTPPPTARRASLSGGRSPHPGSGAARPMWEALVLESTWPQREPTRGSHAVDSGELWTPTRECTGGSPCAFHVT